MADEIKRYQDVVGDFQKDLPARLAKIQELPWPQQAAVLLTELVGITSRVERFAAMAIDEMVAAKIAAATAERTPGSGNSRSGKAEP